MTAPCPFCEIVAGRLPATILHEWTDAIAIAPLNPVVPQHALVIPKHHVRDAVENPAITGLVMQRAAELANKNLLTPCNILTSVGAVATQTVFHLHIHVVPRFEGDGLRLMWQDDTVQASEGAAGNKPLIITINGVAAYWSKTNISYDDVVTLSGQPPGHYSITYRGKVKGDSRREGILSPDQTIVVEERMVFNAYNTSNA